MAKLQCWGRRPSYKNLDRPVNTNCIFNITLSLKHNRQSLFSRAIAHTARGEGRPFVSRLQSHHAWEECTYRACFSTTMV